MALTSASLQAQFDELSASTPVLALNLAPRSLDAADLSAVARLEGKEAVRAVAGALQDAGHGTQECYYCGQAGQPSTSAAAGPDELAFAFACALDFAKKHVRIGSGGFACGRCRALSGSVSRLLQVAATALAGQQRESEHRHKLLQELFLHLAVVNGAEAHITSNPDALAVWAQELLSRAYALQVVATSIRGWQLVGPAGTPIARGTPGAALQLLRELLANSRAPAVKGSGQGQSGQQSTLKRKHAQRQEKVHQEETRSMGSKGSAVPKHIRAQHSTEQAVAAAETKHKKPKTAPTTPATPAVKSNVRALPVSAASHSANGHAANRVTDGDDAEIAVMAAIQSSTTGKKKRLRGPVTVPDVQTATPSAQQHNAHSSKKAPKQHTAGSSNGAATPASAEQLLKSGKRADGATPMAIAAQQHTPVSLKGQRGGVMTAVKATAKNNSKRRRSM